jgi:gas vesicle protein
MNSMPNLKQVNPHDVAVAAFKQADEQIGRADKQRLRVDVLVSKLEQNAMLVGLLLAACIGSAAIAWQSRGDSANEITPQSDLTSSLAPKNLTPGQPSPPAVQASTARAAHPQPAPPAPPALEGAAPTAAAPFAGQTMPRDFATVEQEIAQLKASIEQLKASQEQMARDNAAVAEQLKASQEQMARDNAAVAEQLKANQEQMARLRPTRKPKLSPPQARPLPLAPTQGQTEQQ